MNGERTTGNRAKGATAVPSRRLRSLISASAVRFQSFCWFHGLVSSSARLPVCLTAEMQPVYRSVRWLRSFLSLKSALLHRLLTHKCPAPPASYPSSTFNPSSLDRPPRSRSVGLPLSARAGAEMKADRPYPTPQATADELVHALKDVGFVMLSNFYSKEGVSEPQVDEAFEQVSFAISAPSYHHRTERARR